MTTSVDVPNVGTFVLSTTFTSDDLQPLFEEAWTGSHIWPASLVLANYFVPTRPHEVVLELGSGTGFLGLVAAARGCRVMLSDQQKLVCLLEKNVRLNQHQFPSSHVEVLSLDWTTSRSFVDRASNVSSSIDRTRLDWLLISDCINPIYGPDAVRDLAQTIHTIVGHQHARTRLQILLARQSRGQDQAWVEFQSYFRPTDWTLTVVRGPTADKIQIIHFLRH